MRELPEGWELKALSEVADVILGQSPPGTSYNTEGKGVPFFQGKAEFGDLYPEVRKWTTEPKKLARAGDVLISVRAPVGPTNMAQVDCSVGRGLAALRVRNDIPSKYLLYAVRATSDALASKATGTTFSAISGDQLKAHSVAVAPIYEQQRIVEVIEEQFSRLDAGVESLQRAKRNLRGYRASTLMAAIEGRLLPEVLEMGSGSVDYQMTGFPLMKLPSNWRSTSIGEISTRIEYGSSAKATTSPVDAVPILRMGNISEGSIDLSNLKYLPIDHPDVERFTLKSGDLLFNRTNSPELVGKSAVFSELRQMIFASYLIRVRFVPGVLPEFVAHVINSPLGRSHIAKVRSQQVGQANVNGSKLRRFPIPLPPPEEQTRIVTELARQFSIIDAMGNTIDAGLRRAGTLRQSILSQAFSGRLTGAA